MMTPWSHGNATWSQGPREPHLWQDIWAAGVQEGAQAFEPIEAAGSHYAIRTAGGLEAFAAEELTALQATDVVPLLGKVLFAAPAGIGESKLAEYMAQHLRTAESISLLCWAAPTPSMPHTTKDWLASFYQLCCTRVLPRAEALTRAWLLQTSCRSKLSDAHVSSKHEPSPSQLPQIRFRVSCSRPNGLSTGTVTSLQIAAEAGAFFQEQCGWIVDLHDFDLEVSALAVDPDPCRTGTVVCVQVQVSWHDKQVVIEIPLLRQLSNRHHLLHQVSSRASHYDARSSDCVNSQGLHPGIAFALCRCFARSPMLLGKPISANHALGRLLELAPGDVVLDPLVGKGGCILEAARSHPSVHCIGTDIDVDQLATCIINAQHLTVGRHVDLLHADAACLPFADNSVDAIVTDLPFGKKHARRDGLYGEVLAEACRVLRPATGRIALLTTAKGSIHKLILSSTGWLPISRTEVILGGMKAWIHLIRRAPHPDICSDQELQQD